MLTEPDYNLGIGSDSPGALIAIKRISVTSTLSLAKNLEYELKLYAADAVHLATAISGSSVLLSEDEHLNKRKVKEYARNLNLEIKKLS